MQDARTMCHRAGSLPNKTLVGADLLVAGDYLHEQLEFVYRKKKATKIKVNHGDVLKGALTIWR